MIPSTGILSQWHIYGATGAALSTVITHACYFVGLRLYARKLIKINLFQTHTPRHIIAGGVMGLIIYALAYRVAFFADIRWYTLVFFGTIGLGIYLGLLYVLKEFDKKDYDFYMNIIHPKKMAKYMKGELRNKKKKSDK